MRAPRDETDRYELLKSSDETDLRSYYIYENGQLCLRQVFGKGESDEDHDWIPLDKGETDHLKEILGCRAPACSPVAIESVILNLEDTNMAATTTITPAELAQKIRSKVDELNVLLESAAKRRMTVDLEADRSKYMGLTQAITLRLKNIMQRL